MNRVIASLAAVCALSVAPLAGAAPPLFAVPDDVPVAKALTWKQKFHREELLHKAQDLLRADARAGWQEASDALREALDLQADPAALLWFAAAERKLGRLRQAGDICERARTLAARSGDKDGEERAEHALGAIQKAIPRILVEIPAGVSARVYVDEVVVAAGDDGIEVNPGAHSVLVVAPDRRAYHVDVSAAEGGVYRVRGDLPVIPQAPVAVPPPPPIRPPPQAPDGAIGLGVGGIAVALAGAVMLAVNETSGGPSRGITAAGATLLVAGVGAGVGGLVWGISVARSDVPAGDRSAPAVAFTIRATPMPGAAWVSVGARF